MAQTVAGLPALPAVPKTETIHFNSISMKTHMSV
jgi:hypothetical protein